MAENTNEWATKEYVQKEHKETTRVIVGVALAISALMGGAVVLVNMTIGSRIDNMTVEFREMRTELKHLSEGQARMEALIQGLQSKK